MELWGDGGLYGAWSDYLNRWAGASSTLTDRPPALQPEDFEPSTWYRLTLRIQDSVNTRLGRWQDILVRNLVAATDEFSWGRTLVDARQGLRPLLAFCSLPELTEELRASLRRQLEGAVRGAQQQLEDDALNAIRHGIDAAGAEIRLRQLRSNSLTAVLSDSPLDGATSGSPSPALLGPPTGVRRRQILID